MKRTIDGAATVFTYDEWKPIVEWSGAGAFVAWNLYGPGADEILVRYQPNTGGHVHYHLDAMGNVQFLLSGELNLGLEKYTYDAFGQPRITGWNGDVRPISRYGNRFLFTGREYLYTLGIYDYRHRLYHPGLGRFIQTDPIGFGGDVMNPYRYCTGNPILHGDPTGLRSEMATDFIWKTACLFDSGNSYQGSYGEFMKPAGNDSATVAPRDEGKKEQAKAGPNIPTHTKIEHDETFDVTKDDIYVKNRDGSVTLAQAKTFRQLEKPEAELVDGRIEYTQRLTSHTTFHVGIPLNDVMREWRRVESVRQEVKDLRFVAQVAAMKGFRDAETAKRVIGGATQYDFNTFLLRDSAKFEVIGGGK